MESQEDLIDFQRFWPAIQRRWIFALAAFGSMMAVTAVYTFTKQPVYEANGQILLKQGNAASDLTGLGSQDLGSLSSLTARSSPVETEAAIVRSLPIVNDVIRTLKLRDYEGEILDAETFLQNLNVNNLRNTDILEISYKSIDPQEAVHVVDTLIDIYKRENIIDNREDLTSARKYVEQQLPAINAELRNLDLRIRAFKEQNRIADLTAEGTASVEIEAKLVEQFTEAQAQRAAATNQVSALQQRLGMTPQGGQVSNAISQSTGVQSVLAEYQKVESELAVARAELQPNHPKILALADKQSELRTLLGERVRTVVQGKQPSPNFAQDLQAGTTQQELVDSLIKAEVERIASTGAVAAINTVIFANNQRRATLPRLEQVLIELERRRGVAQGTYETLLKSLQSLRLSENQNVGNIRIVQAAILEPDPVSPRILLNLIIGGVLSTFLAIGVILLLESRDKSVKTADVLQELYALATLLGTIPLMKGVKQPEFSQNLQKRPTPELVVQSKPHSQMAEAYRTLRVNLKFLSSTDRPLKAIVLTSALPQEGKSTVAANLALAIAEAGYKVLLVDADLRLPTQHKIWELPNKSGLSNLITEDSDVNEHIQQLSERVHVLTAGTIPPNPLVLVESQRMGALIDKFCSLYDYVLIDSPPINAVADSLVLSRHVHGIVMVARLGVIDTSSAKIASGVLAKLNHPMLGLVINGDQNESRGSYYYGDYYGTNPDTSSVNGHSKFNGKSVAQIKSSEQLNETFSNDELPIDPLKK
ncbi:MAG: polysaccharide biosynthesis tyrosine autokinase [Aphanocapsa sp. GSE-SYN-MK-11-07L]|jgi:capsular exopolysaccharide synthesis family protein|nr:polysaccharide biosynthesis tyrosine autokinase [Aphanocapsa sp. GSE-SYN-MK-11-07L]